MSPVTGNNPFPDEKRRERLKQDMELVQAVLSGSVESWHVFVDRYTGLVMSVLRQQLFVEDIDEIRNVYVDVLEDLFNNKLKEYGGRASLATWLVLVTRGKATDYLRRKRGRRQLPRGWEALSEFDRRVFQLYFVEGLGFDSILCALEWESAGSGAGDIAGAVERIIERIDGRYLKRLNYENDARRQGTGAGNLPEYLYHAETALRERQSGGIRNPEEVLADGEHERELERLAALRRSLPEEDRVLLELRYERGWTARRISDELDMGGQRKVYSALDRAVRRLRALFAPDDADAGLRQDESSAETRDRKW
jgi:RNA polymerase sigma factor (sigma-70 family)